MSPPTVQRVRQTLSRLRSELLAEKTDAGHWEGELAGSALSTATAVSALASIHIHGQSSDEETIRLIRRGVAYLGEQQNHDGGFGDTDLSHSNIATSYLVLAASTLANQACDCSLDAERKSRLSDYIAQVGGTDGLRERYGKDKTFVIPILTNLAIAGLVDWNDVQALPFEAAVFPQSMYRFLSIPVVSYAIPALVAIGQARHFHGRRAFLPLRLIRSASVKRTLNKLIEIQPSSGGYLEATPLTAFVAMSLAATHRADHAACVNALKFLKASIRENGSWPIDTNLATWVTSLAVHALACDPDDQGEWHDEALANWHLGCQLTKRHPFTGAAPGGWGWTDLSGSVPDGDDTPGAILAMRQHQKWCDSRLRQLTDDAITKGWSFLTGLQNRDGGWPTFCRGWGTLPFDRSSVDLTAHALRAGDGLIDASRRSKAIRFLHRQQQPDGSWLPLWFGNQDLPDESNPIYGTSRVLLAGCVDKSSTRRAIDFLIANQNPDGGWGGGKSVQPKLDAISAQRGIHVPPDLVSTIEETALTVEALTTCILIERDFGTAGGVQTHQQVTQKAGAGERHLLQTDANVDVKQELGVTAGTRDAPEAIIAGVEFLLRSVDDNRHQVAWPIGFYFAKLWYHEKLYPLVFTVAALGKYLRSIAEEHDPSWPK